MAIFHFSHKVVSRGQGQSVIAAAAYQSRSCLHDERDGQTKDYSKHGQQELLASGIYAPKDAPEWVFDREKLWNAAERAEDQHNKTRAKSAITAQHIELALPHELTEEQNRRLVVDFVRDNFTRKGFVCDVNIHSADRQGDQRNTHAHILVTMRKLEGEQFSAEKNRMDKTQLREQVKHWRENWAKYQSRHLERAGFKMEAARMIYGHKTLEEQQKIAEARGDHEHAEALKREPTIHEGATATQMKREGKGEESRLVAFNQQAAERREELAKDRAEFKKLLEAEQKIYYTRTPAGKLSRLDRRHEWQRDKLQLKQERDQIRQQNAQEWERHKDAQGSPVVAAWNERERARQQIDFERAQAEERAALEKKQQEHRDFAVKFWTIQDDEKKQAKANLYNQKPERNLYRPGLRETLRNMGKSEAQQEHERNQARYYKRVKEEQREQPTYAEPVTEPRQDDPKPEPQKTRAQLRTEELQQARGQRMKRPDRPKRPDGR